MNRTILYYPTINIPKKAWLRNALLYWDEVSSIVPKSWDDKFLIKLSPEIHYLIDEGQFRAIKPEDLILKTDNWEVFQNFQDELKEIVTSPQFKSFINRQNYKRAYRVHPNKVGYDLRVHRNKTSDNIFHLLEEQGLASRPQNDEWINFERNTALLYMSLLAKYLADIDSEHTSIGTDYSSYEKLNFKRVNESQGFPVINFNLNNVLPTPKNNVPFEKIIDFKRRRKDNLQNFKKTLSDFQTDVSNSESNAQIKEHVINFQDNLTTGLKDLHAVLKDEKLGHTAKSLKSMISLNSPTTLTTLGTVVNNQIDLINIPMEFNLAGLAFMGSIELSANFIEKRNKKRAIIRENPFSYVHYAYKQGIIHKPY